jgi:hypothetical protein
LRRPDGSSKKRFPEFGVSWQRHYSAHRPSGTTSRGMNLNGSGTLELVSKSPIKSSPITSPPSSPNPAVALSDVTD